MKLRLVEQLQPSATPGSDKLTCLDFRHLPAEQLHMVFAGTELGYLHSWMWNLAQTNVLSTPQRHHSQVLCAPDDHPMGRVNALVCIGAPSDPAKCLVFAAGCGSSMHVWRVSQVSSEHVQLLQGHDSLVTGLADCKKDCIASCSLDGAIRLWAPAEPKDDEFVCVAAVQGRPSGCLSWQNWAGPVAVNSFGDSHLWSCYVGAHDGSVVVYRRSAEAARTSLEHHATWRDVHRQAIIRLLAVQSIHGSFVLSSSYDGSCKLLDGTSGMVCFEIAATQVCSELRQEARYFTGVAWDDQAGLICVCDNAGGAQLWNPFRDNKVASFQLGRFGPREPRHGPPPCFVDLRVTEERILYTLSDQGATYWRLEESDEQRFRGHKREVIAIQLPPHSTPSRRADSVTAAEGVLFTAAADNKVCCWDEYDTELRYSLEDGRQHATREVTTMAVVWLHNTVVVGYDDGHLAFWNCATRAKLTNHQHTDRITCLHLCCVGANTVLLTAGADGYVGAWQLEPIRRASQPLTMISFQQPFDSGSRASARRASEAKFDMEEKEEFQAVAALAMHQSLLTVFAASDDGQVAFWHLHDNLSQIAAGVASVTESVTSVACVEDLLIAGCSNGVVQILQLVFEKRGRSKRPTLRPVTIIPDARWRHSIRTLVGHRAPGSDGAILIAALQGDVVVLWRYEVRSGSARPVSRTVLVSAKPGSIVCRMLTWKTFAAWGVEKNCKLYQARYPSSRPSCLQVAFSVGASSLMAAEAPVQAAKTGPLARLFVGFEDGSVCRYHVSVR